MKPTVRHNHKKHICLIGGGHTHMTVIRQLSSRPLSDTHITLISTDTHTPYSGMLPGLIAGHYTFDDCHIDLPHLCQKANVQFIHSNVQRVNPNSHTIACTQRPPIVYDLLSINIGSQSAIKNISGSSTYGYPIRPIKKFLSGWYQWLTSQSNSNQTKHIVIVGGGAAGIETLLAMHYYLHKATTINAKFTLICADTTILPTHNATVQQFFLQHFKSLDVTIKYSEVTAIDKHQLHLRNGSSIAYDFTVWAIHAGAYPWPAKNGLVCDHHGFIKIDQYLRSISHTNIFATGDCAAFMPRTLPKAGVFAVRQGPTLLNNLIATYKSQSLTPFKPQQHFLSLLTTGKRHAVASHGSTHMQGKWIWYWKNYIDRKFIESFK